MPHVTCNVISLSMYNVLTQRHERDMVLVIMISDPQYYV